MYLYVCNFGPEYAQIVLTVVEEQQETAEQGNDVNQRHEDGQDLRLNFYRTLIAEAIRKRNV